MNLLEQALADFERAHSRAFQPGDSTDITWLEGRIWARTLDNIVIERARCVEAICGRCSMGERPEFQSDPTPAFWHGTHLCSATPIHLLSASYPTTHPIMVYLVQLRYRHPHWRLMQIIFNALDRKGLARDAEGHPRDIFYVSDLRLEEALCEEVNRPIT